MLNVPLGPSAGFTSFYANQGTLINKGIELALNADIVKNDNFTWNISGNISMNRNKIDKLGLDPATYGSLGQIIAFEGRQISGGTYFKQPANIFIEGEEVGLFFGYATDGIIRNESDLATTGGGTLSYGGVPLAIGDVKYIDQDGDGNITSADRTIIGNPNPDFTYGVGTTLQYKNLSLNVLFNGTYGNDIANGNLMETAYANNNTKNIRVEAYEDAFNPDTNPNGSYPRLGTGGFGIDYTTDLSDRIIEDGSFLRLSYVTLGYDIPVKKINGIESAKVTVSGQNLLLFTNYSGFDPEVNSFSFDPLRIGVDWGSFPNQRTFTMGLNITF